MASGLIEWTEAEIEAMLVSHPQSGAEIAQSDAIGGWADLGITDSVAFVEELRRKRKERQWHRYESTVEE